MRKHWINTVTVTKSVVDMDTVKAIVNGRFVVMARYGRDVVLRVVQDEMHKADNAYRSLLEKTRRMLVREESLMDDHAKRRLESVLKQNQALKAVYHFKQRLQGIWKRSTDSNESLLHAVQEWCSQAEETGIKALQDFAQALRGYSLRPVQAM